MSRSHALAGLVAGAALAFAATAEPARFGVDDLVRIANVSDLDLSPDGEWVVYSVGEPNFEEDTSTSDLWRARWDGSGKRALTRTPDADEYQPAVSPDGKWIAFLSDRGDEDAKTQVWVMPADAARRNASRTFRVAFPTSTGRRTARGSPSSRTIPSAPRARKSRSSPSPSSSTATTSRKTTSAG